MRHVDVQSKSPCNALWDEMPPVAEGRRLCHSCQHQVVDLSSMTEKQAKHLLVHRPPAGLCVTYLMQPSGEIEFQQSVRGRAARGVAAASVALALSACNAEPVHVLGAPEPGRYTGAPLALSIDGDTPAPPPNSASKVSPVPGEAPPAASSSASLAVSTPPPPPERPSLVRPPPGPPRVHPPPGHPARCR